MLQTKMDRRLEGVYVNARMVASVPEKLKFGDEVDAIRYWRYRQVLYARARPPGRRN